MIDKNKTEWMNENEWMNVFHSVLARRSRQPKFICSQKGFFGDKKHSFPMGMSVVGGFICYKDLTRQRRVIVKILNCLRFYRTVQSHRD